MATPAEAWEKEHESIAPPEENKWGQTGSVENLSCFLGRRCGGNHEVERDRAQSHLLILRRAGSRGQRRAQPPLVHAHPALALAPLAVELFRPVLVQERAVEPAGHVLLVVRGPAGAGADDAD